MHGLYGNLGSDFHTPHSTLNVKMEKVTDLKNTAKVCLNASTTHQSCQISDQFLTLTVEMPFWG